MPSYKELTNQELNSLYLELMAEYQKVRAMSLKLDMSRGKPGIEQLDLSKEMLTCLSDDEYMSDGVDCRNYGGLDGLPAMKKIFADILDLEPEQIIVGGNSSLSMMFDNIASNMTHGVRDGIPWVSQGKVKFLCPVPGYDRHFSICKYFHIDMIPIPMNENGPDMDIVERLVSDSMIKGMWCVPKYSNPDGIVYSDETIRRIANLRPAAKDFRLYWDNAYAIHNLYEEEHPILNISDECIKADNANMPLIFTSFSKISFAGCAVSCMASSQSNIEYIKRRLGVQTIGPDKLNQLRHVKFFKNAEGVYEQMRKHADILRPKFELTEKVLNEELAPLNIAEWSNPRGGYFISFYSLKGCARKIVSYCRDCGLYLTDAGATYPHYYDPNDRNIRIAPSLPLIDELKQALDVFCLCVKLASVEALLMPEPSGAPY